MCESERKCCNCGSVVERGTGAGRGRCGGCYSYIRRNGVDRPAAWAWGKIGWCQTCKQKQCRGLYSSECVTCYEFRLKNRRQRPRHLWAERCRHCKMPRPAYGERKGYCFRKGRCNACYWYVKNHGIERPQRFIDRQAPNGWCDCGQPAATVIQVPSPYEAPPIDLPLCEECAAMEMES